MTPARAWYENLNVDCILALDDLLGEGPHSDEAFLHLARERYRTDFSMLQSDIADALQDALEELASGEGPAQRLVKEYKSMAPEILAAIAEPTLSAGYIDGLEYATGNFRILLGDISDAASETIDGCHYQPLGHIQPLDGSEPCYAWIAFVPTDAQAPVYLCESSGSPERLADNFQDFISRIRSE